MGNSANRTRLSSTLPPGGGGPNSFPEEILTKRELAERLKISLRKVEDLHLPNLDLGYRSKRYLWSVVLAHLQTR